MVNPYDEMLELILPDLIQRFQKKSNDYGDVFYELGLGGQYSDMHRKMHKLKKAMWNNEELQGEQPDEILSDLFGNILISLYLYANSEESARPAGAQPSSGQDTNSQGTPAGGAENSTWEPLADEVRQSASP